MVTKIMTTIPDSYENDSGDRWLCSVEDFDDERL